MEIGNVSIEYDILGKPKSAQFIAAKEIEIKSDTLRVLRGGDNVDDVKHNAQIVFSTWFKDMIDVELKEGTLKSEMIECIKYPNGMIKQCIIKFSFDD